MTDEILKKYYYDSKFGFLSVEKFYHKLQDEGINISRKKVKEFIDKQETEQVTKIVRKKKKFNTIVAAFPGSNFQMDLMIYDRYEFNNYKYVLNVVDVYSRFAQSRPLTNKRLETIIESLKDIFKVMGFPLNLNCDNEFNKKEFIDFVAPHDVVLWFSQPNDVRHNAIVERFNRTLANLLQKWRTATGKHNWPSILSSIVDNYNSSHHTTLKGKPIDVWNSKILNPQKAHKEAETFKEDDKVRIKLHKKTFDKGDVHKFSKEIYHVTDVNGNRVFLENSNGDILERWYRPEELLLIDDVQTIPQDQEEPVVHKKTKTAKKIKRDLRKEGIDEGDIVEAGKKRKKVPIFRDPGDRLPKRKPPPPDDDNEIMQYWIAGD